MYAIEIELSIEPTDSNRILGVNKYAKHKVFSRVKDEIAKLTTGKRPESPLEKFSIYVTRHSKRTLDYDNFIASLKPVIDGLRMAGIIKDDSWKYVHPQSLFTNQVISQEKKLVVKVVENQWPITG